MRSSCAPYKMCGGGNQENEKGIAVLDMNGVKGVVVFKKSQGGTLRVSYDITGLSDGEHGFHVHEYGDLTGGCGGACAHFNPTGKEHGGRYGTNRHAGDLGNIRAAGDRAKGSFTATGISVDPRKKESIIGRSIVVHADRDDLGKGGDAESKKTGNAGKRLACAVIGISK